MITSNFAVNSDTRLRSTSFDKYVSDVATLTFYHSIQGFVMLALTDKEEFEKIAHRKNFNFSN